ncbi:MAG: hypothetical protein R6U62_08390 [Bacteroidales bacterium]
MPIITRKTFQELADVKQEPCVSIYIPTNRVGDNKEAQIALKNKTREIRKTLEAHWLKEKQVEEFMKPLNMLLEDSSLWRYMSDGLAVFMSPGKFAYSTFPAHFRERAEVSNRFHLLPLIPMYNNDGRFLILALSLQQARLFEGTRDYIMEIGIEDLVPQKIEDSVGHDYEEKSLQFSGATRGGQGVYHGHGSGKDDKKEEVLKHLREVDKNLAEVLQDYEAPLLLACVEYIFGLYRKVNTYKNLHGSYIQGSPENKQMDTLHREAWALLEEAFNKQRREALEHYHFLTGKSRTTTIMGDIVQAAKNGRIDSLFVLKDKNLYGVFDSASGDVDIHDKKRPDNHCLLDRSAIDAFLQGGRVYLMDEDEMPEEGTMAAAALRY